MCIEKDDLIEIISALTTLHDETATFFNKYGLDPVPGSKAISELTTFRMESVQTSYAQGSMLIEVSAEQITSLVRSLTEPVLTIAPWTSARAIIESSALASWLLDSTISAKDRVQRSFAFRFEGLSQQVKFARASGLEMEKALKRIDYVEEDAITLGFSIIKDKIGKRIGIGQLFPTMTNLVCSVLNEEPAYRLFSALIHAHPWAMQQISFCEAKNNSHEHSDYSHNTTFFEKSLQSEAIIYLCHKAAYAFSRPIWYKAHLYGYELPEFRRILNRVFDKLKFSSSTRFWNTP